MIKLKKALVIRATELDCFGWQIIYIKTTLYIIQCLLNTLFHRVFTYICVYTNLCISEI